MLEKTEGTINKKTGNIEYKGQNTKTNKAKHIIQYVLDTFIGK